MIPSGTIPNPLNANQAGMPITISANVTVAILTGTRTQRPPKTHKKKKKKKKERKKERKKEKEISPRGDKGLCIVISAPDGAKPVREILDEVAVWRGSVYNCFGFYSG
jgi:hypothetical protein